MNDLNTYGITKRRVSVLIPYLEKWGKVRVFLQKRSANAKRGPGRFAFFGGGIEKNETPEVALNREIKEELDFTPAGAEFFGNYESQHAILNVFIIKVTSDFESKIIVKEGDYGMFFSENKILEEKNISNTDKKVLEDFYKK